MNKIEAYEAMRDGFTIKNEYYTEGEWLKMNEEGVIVTEEGYTMALEEWEKHQNSDVWEIIGDADKFIHANRDLSPTSLPFTLIHPGHNIYEPYMHMSGTRKERQAIITPVQPRSDINRNDPCMCGSGKKYKKCCGA